MSSDEPAQYDPTVEVDDDDQRVEGHTFLGGYDAHDIGEEHVRRHLEHMGFAVEAWGIDMRHDNHVLGDDKMDLKAFTTADIHSPVTGEVETEKVDLAALIEVKTKRSEGWFGVVNRHHFRKYLQKAHEFDVPAYIYMSLVDDEEEAVIRDTFIPVQEWDELTKVQSGEYDYYSPDSVEQFLVEQIDKHPQIERTWRAPDGNQVVELDTETGIDWTELTYQLSHE